MKKAKTQPKSAGGIYFQNQNCARRMTEISRLADYFRSNGWEIVNDPASADYIVVSTCGYTREKTDESIDRIMKLKDLKGELLLSGCLPAIEPRRLADIFEGPVIRPNRLEEIDGLFPAHPVKMSDIPQSNHLNIDTSGRHPQRERRFFVTIGQGCLGQCTFCAIRRAIGRFRSKPVDTCLGEIKQGLARGFRHFHLLSEDVGAFGADRGTTFPELLKRIFVLAPSIKVKFEDFQPRWAVQYLDELLPMVREGRIYCILSPIQSGSEKVLRAMNRFADTDRMMRALIRLRQAHSHLTLMTNCIVGFPGETWPAFKESVDMMKAVDFDIIRLFPYSPIENTAAAAMTGKVSGAEIRRRLDFAARQLGMSGYRCRFKGDRLDGEKPSGTGKL